MPGNDEALTQFCYLLNAFEAASQSERPAENGYGRKRQALFAHVRALEAAAEERDRLVGVVLWALGEGDDFPDWPATVTLTGNPKWWWRKELRERYERALATPPAAKEA